MRDEVKYYVKEPKPGQVLVYPGNYVRERTQPSGDYRVEQVEKSGRVLELSRPGRPHNVHVERGPHEFWTIVPSTANPEWLSK